MSVSPELSGPTGCSEGCPRPSVEDCHFEYFAHFLTGIVRIELLYYPRYSIYKPYRPQRSPDASVPRSVGNFVLVNYRHNQVQGAVRATANPSHERRHLDSQVTDTDVLARTTDPTTDRQGLSTGHKGARSCHQQTTHHSESRTSVEEASRYPTLTAQRYAHPA